jgi:hypoxanthine phosphoribosyltransferase
MTFNPTDVFDVLFTRQEIENRCLELGAEISRTYGQEPLIAVGIMRGCMFFFTEILKHVTTPLKLDFMVVSSYGDGQTSSGQIKFERDLKEDIRGYHVLIVDDVVDTGLTLSSLLEMLKLRNPRSLKICTMLDKPASHKVPLHVDFAGFSIEKHFVVGYGLDYKQFYRNMNFIGKLKEGKQPLLDAHINSLVRHD